MLFMNRCEIMQAKERYRNHPVLGPATRLLDDLRALVDHNSDGWCYWCAPVDAAKQLITMIQDPETATPACFKKAVTPIKAFCARHKLPFPNEEGRRLYKKTVVIWSNSEDVLQEAAANAVNIARQGAGAVAFGLSRDSYAVDHPQRDPDYDPSVEQLY